MVLPLERAAAPNFEQFSQKIQQVFVQKVKTQLFSAYLLQFTMYQPFICVAFYLIFVVFQLFLFCFLIDI